MPQSQAKPEKQEVQAVEEEFDSSPVENELKEKTDSLLDEIDDVLEENALEVLSRYVQQGGE
jgi:ubiquitin-like protein Pup